jgi:Patatin-like phospholipase
MNRSTGDSDNRWSVIDELANLIENPKFKGSLIIDREPDLEACLGRVLRPHDEAGFQSPNDDWMIRLRARLDEALGSLTLREIRVQLGLPSEQLPKPTQANLWKLFHSEAFLRYINAYLFFGIRFVASRAEVPSSSGSGEWVSCADSNVRPFALMPPPVLAEAPGARQRFEEFARLTARQPATAADTALSFLDDFHPPQQGLVQYELQEPSQYELWLRGLYPETEEKLNERFEEISKGLAEWARRRSDFYLSLDPQAPAHIQSVEGVEEQPSNERPPQGWLVTHPMAARLALADVYWIARLLRADVSANATVTYHKDNWLHLLRFHLILARDLDGSKALVKAEEALRSVFDYVCDLIQNSVEITREEDRSKANSGDPNHLPLGTERWRAVFNEELDEIARQRRVRHFRDPSLPPEATAGPRDEIGPIVSPGPGEPGASARVTDEGVIRSFGAGSGSNTESSDGIGRGNLPPSPSSATNKSWSKRITTGDGPFNLIGLAFSGGGIRSATFNLGVLQGLQELDLLRHIDYLSTVSGGGFIGSWLMANVRRSANWLGRLTDWSDSIAHLRAHSNYLAPRSGILSADTWNMGNSWFRNAILIQLTGLAWLFALLQGTLVVFRLFLLAGQCTFLLGFSWAAWVMAIGAVFLIVAIPYNLYGTSSNSGGSKRRRARWVRRLAVTPGWVGACALASQFWATAPLISNAWPCLAGLNSYSGLLKTAWSPWRFILLAAVVGFFVITMFTLRRHRWHAIWISLCCTSVLYLELVGIFLLFRIWSGLGDIANGLGFVFGPSLVLLAFSVCVLLLIGFTGRNTDEARREWWTRLGTWLGIFAGIGLFVCGIAVFGPWLVLHFFTWAGTDYKKTVQSIKWSAILSWLGTVVGGLFAGKSSKTDGEGDTASSTLLEALARVGGFLFIVGSFLLGSTLLFILIFEIFASEPTVSTAHPLHVLCELSVTKIAFAFIAALGIGSVFSWFFEINIFGLNQFYRNRLVRCYLGATRWTPGVRKPNPFTKFDFRDDLGLSRFRTDSPGADLPNMNTPALECGPYRGPLPILNCALNLGGSTDLSLNTRHSASFTLTSLRCGSDRPKVGYAPTWSPNGSFADGVPLGQAVSISGAAVSPNMGYNTSPLVAFLLTMFNVRLGWWFPNPGQVGWSHSKPVWRRRGMSFSLFYLVMDLLGIADEKRNFLSVSDGGHFENLAIYELIRRRCKLIIACDAECDQQLQFGGLGNMIRICETDFGAMIDIDVKSIRPGKEGHSLAHCAVGTIKYCSGEIGRLIYLKASMTGDEDVNIAQFRSSHPAFPHESTSNQFYSEDQFESYRKLGLHIVRSSFKGNLPGDDPHMIGERMADVLTPAGCSSEAFHKHGEALGKIWESFRASSGLLPFMQELISLEQETAPAAVTDEELCIGLELIQLMEDVFLDLRLDDFWEHPDNRGWAILFMRWARSPRFRLIWDKTRRTFGIRFEYFCRARLGLTSDRPIVRV